VLDNEANKLMLEADSLQASEEKYKLSYYEIEKKQLLLLVTVLLMTTSGVYSQKQLTSSRQHVPLLLCRETVFCKDSTW
jgi:hypothetical protein